MSEKPPKPSNPARLPPVPVPPTPARPNVSYRLPTLRVGQHLVRLVDLLEALLGGGIRVDVRVPLLGELAEGALDLGVEAPRSTPRTW